MRLTDVNADIRYCGHISGVCVLSGQVPTLSTLFIYTYY